jgi:hypothetical protein
MSTARRGILAFLTTALVAVGLSVVGPSSVPPAGATEQPAFQIGPNERVSIDYPQIIGNNAANQAIDPDTCRQPVTTYCYAIHLHLNRPADLNPDEEFTLRFRLSWEVLVEDVDVPTQGEMTSNDLDFFIWNYPYVKAAAGEPEVEEAGSAATGAQPEQTSFNTPKSDDFWLIIVNFVGVNQGSNLSITWDPEVFGTPFEDLGGAAPRDLSAEESAVTPSFISPDAGLSLTDAAPAFFTPPGGFSGFSATGVPALTSVAVDDTFLGGVESSLDADLLAEAQRLSARRVSAIRPAKPVAAAIVGFWLIAVPLALLAVAVILLLRRRPAALSI